MNRQQQRSEATRKSSRGLRLALLLLLIIQAEPGQALTANKVLFEFHTGFYRVIVQYTVPALREYREAVAEFKSKKEAETFYWHLVRGGDFFLGDPGKIHFETPRQGPDPW